MTPARPHGIENHDRRVCSFGVLKAAHRTDSGYRVYGDDDLHSLAFIKRSSIRIRVKVQQAKSKTGPWHDVSDGVVVDS